MSGSLFQLEVTDDSTWERQPAGIPVSAEVQIIGDSAALRKIIEQVALVAPTDAATNRDLQNEVTSGRFREDLYYRLSVFPLKVAALRERQEDIPLLATHFIRVLVRALGCPEPRLTQAGIETLLNYDWPGNIRELQNAIERAVIFAKGGALQFDLPGNPGNLTSIGPKRVEAAEPEYLTEPELRRRERENLFAVLQKTKWKIKGTDGAAALLGIRPTTLISRIAKMGLKRPHVDL
jgi:transcriptional regulator with GAF, ATPase, and Fis domain